MYEIASVDINDHKESLEEFKNIIKSSTGEITQIYSKSRSLGRFLCEEFLYKAFLEVNLVPKTVDDVLYWPRTQSDDPLWINTDMLLPKSGILSETQWLVATQGIKHIVFNGSMNSRLFRLCTLIRDRTFLWIISIGQVFPCRNSNVLILGEGPIPLNSQRSLGELLKYRQLLDIKRNEIFDLQRISLRKFVGSLTYCQCIIIIAFFIASNKKDIFGLYNRQSRREKSKSTVFDLRKRTKEGDDGFNARMVSYQVLSEAFLLVLGHALVIFSSKRGISYDEYFLRDNQSLMIFEPSDQDIECLCKSGYVSQLKSHGQPVPRGFAAKFRAVRTKYRTHIPFNLLFECCKKLSLESASYV